ncbi:MAG: hypothetical protein ABI972_12895 [Acidobacteriota bacterium]
MLAIPPSRGELRSALPVLERLWAQFALGPAGVMLGWGTEADQDLWKVLPIEVTALGDRILNLEKDGIFEYGEGDLLVENCECRFLFCHEGDFHVETANEAIVAAARSEFTGMGWECLDRFTSESPADVTQV